MSSSSIRRVIGSLNTAVPRGQVNGASGATGGTGSASILPVTFQPGGTSHPNVFTTEAALNTALGASFGPQTVFVDLSVAGGSYSASGNLDLGEYVVGVFYNTTNQFATIFTSSNITTPYQLQDFVVNGSSGPTFSVPTRFLVLSGNSGIVSLDSTYVWAPAESAGLDLYGDSFVGNGSLSAIQVNDISLTINMFDNSQLRAGSIAISGGGTVAINVCSTAVQLDPSFLSLSGVSVQYSTNASFEGYNNGLVAPPIPGSPVQVQSAIDGFKPTLDIPKSISYNLSQLQALGAATSVSLLVFACPANTRVTQPEIVVTQTFTGPSLSGVSLTMQGSSDANGTLVDDANGLMAVSYGLGTNPYPSRGGQSIDVEIVLAGGTTFAQLTAGGFTARIVTQISAL